jgi:hypothetical protein
MAETTTAAAPSTASPASSPVPTAAPQPSQTPQSSPQPASRPGSISAADYHRLDPAEQSKFANLPDGQWIERSKLPSKQADPTKPATADGAASVTENGKLKVGDYELSADDVAMLMQTKAAADLKATQVPADASGYEAKLPEGMKLPEGLDFRPDSADPAFKDFQALAKKIGLSQIEFSKLYGTYIAKTLASEAEFRNVMKGELAKLGANATMRVTALETWLRGMVGDDIAKNMRAGLFSEKQVRGLEIIANKMATQGHATFSQAHREPAGPQGRVSEEEWAGMSSAEKWNYARGHDQAQFKTANSGG